MAEEFPAVETTSSGRVLEIPTRGRTPNVNDDVFISVDGTVEKIKELLAERVVFIRAAVASGKTTLAQYLVNELPNEFVEVEDGSSAEEWYEEFVRVSGRNDLGGAPSKIKAREALREIGRQGKTIVIDEAHLLFNFPQVVKVLIRDMEKAGKPKILHFSAAATGDYHGVDATTPPEITEKYMWYPPIPNGNTLVQLLDDAGVHLTADSVDFFMQLCCGRRGIFMRAMNWVKEQQEQDGSADRWQYRDTISRVRQTLDESRKAGLKGWTKGLLNHLQKSRAVRVNSRYSQLSNIPAEVVEVVYAGPKTAEELNGRERELTIAGFLVPVQKKIGEEFEPYDWTFPGVQYGISNSIMANFYNEAFNHNFELLPEKVYPSSAADLYCRLPRLWTTPCLTWKQCYTRPCHITECYMKRTTTAPSLLFFQISLSTLSRILSVLLAKLALLLRFPTRRRALWWPSCLIVQK